eukprot:CAMPEP_0168334726 /NCGR_PEP_ID=MMETSP0213-20121227/10460_1 /TAXON_ID=151035 /ORGANISM="Euplotes harpa, Strain FSP1.4" /LENGTH=47 /DNA_ID= /DNA_START= /DNA_END= /DNA_ORIENTATION=
MAKFCLCGTSPRLDLAAGYFDWSDLSLLEAAKTDEELCLKLLAGCKY